MPLRQPHSRLIAHQIAVKIIRRRQPQRPKQKNLPRRRLQQIRAAHDFGDPHRRIVHHHRQLIRRHIVAPPNNEVAEVAPRNKPLRPEMQVRQNKSPRHPEPETANSLRRSRVPRGTRERRTPRPSREREAERLRNDRSQAGTFPDKPAHHPHHSARPPPSPHPSANRYTDKSIPVRAASSRPEDKAPAAHSAHTARKPRRSPALRSTRSPASANLRTSPTQTPAGSAANPNLHCGKSTARDVLSLAPPQSKTSAHVQDAEARSAKAQAARGRRG